RLPWCTRARWSAPRRRTDSSIPATRWTASAMTGPKSAAIWREHLCRTPVGGALAARVAAKAPPTKKSKRPADGCKSLQQEDQPMRVTRLACAVAFGLACHSALAATAYVSNEKDDSISVIDLDSLEVTATLEVGMRPRGLLLSSDNKLLYICASDSDRVDRKSVV